MNLGILGGGQLARMLALAAAPLGLKALVLSESSDDPAAQVTGFWRPGYLQDASALREFAKNLDLMTFESEFIEAAFLQESLMGLPLHIFPNLRSLEILQDRKSQKEELKSHQIPTAPFFAVSTEEDLKNANKLFKGEFVLKQRKNGYDGNGTFYCQGDRGLHELSPLLKKHPKGFIAEAFVKFKNECALMAFRSADGSFITYPLVETHQVHSRCDWVLGPTTHPRLKSLTEKIKNLMESLDYVGALGIELFNTGKELLVNELAPRVHNTGHYSQNAMVLDQFQLHLLCGMGAPLEKPQLLSKAFAMVNLIGTHTRAAELAPTSAALHWYGKTENREGRKMGHLNMLGSNKKDLLKEILRERKKFDL